MLKNSVKLSLPVIGLCFFGLSACGQVSLTFQPSNASDGELEPSAVQVSPDAPQEVFTEIEPLSSTPGSGDSYLSKIVPLPVSQMNKWVLYDNPLYQFAFQYPDRWQLTEIPGESRTQHAPTPWADAVLLSNDPYDLMIWYNRTDEERSFLQVAERGERVNEGTIVILGETVPVVGIQTEGMITAILYGDEHFWAGDLHFSIALVDHSNGQEAAPGIPPLIRNDVLAILGSLVASSADYAPPAPEAITDDLPCSTTDDSSQWQVICSVRDALVSDNLSTLAQMINEPFPLGYWGSEFSRKSLGELMQELRTSRLPANRAGLRFTQNRDQFPPLSGTPPEGMLGPSNTVSAVIYSEGWGSDGHGAALLLFGPDSQGQIKLKSIIVAQTHFDK